ncbi:MAG: L,D-transpeptidase family protein [Mycobacteriales bacterium]
MTSVPPKPVFRYDVAATQRQLTTLKYYVGAIDGARGPSLRSAVMAFQKVQGIGADGIVGPSTLAALAKPTSPTLRGNAPANRVEIDLTKQVLYVVKGGAVSRIMPVSSGNGATYSQKSGGTAKALTPAGYFTIQRRIIGERKADLGTLYDPQYFYRGWAIHGSNSVPARPASHGCVRVTRPDGKYLLKALTVGMSVYLYGGSYTFTAGSKAPGTDNPTGDTASDAPIEPTPTASPTPSKTASPSPSASPTASASTPPSGSTSPSPSPTTG